MVGSGLYVPTLLGGGTHRGTVRCQLAWQRDLLRLLAPPYTAIGTMLRCFVCFFAQATPHMLTWPQQVSDRTLHGACTVQLNIFTLAGCQRVILSRE